MKLGGDGKEKNNSFSVGTVKLYWKFLSVNFLEIMNRKFASASKIPIPALKKCEEKQSSTPPKFTIFSETGLLLKDSKSSLKLLV